MDRPVPRMPSCQVLALALALLSFASGAAAATLNVPGSFATIQAALNASSNGDTVLVASGTYFENLTLPAGRDVILRGSGAASTTIDGSNSGPVITIAGGQSRATVVEGFTIRNGLASDGGGIAIRNDSSPTIRDNTIRSNTATSAGGGIKVSMGGGVTGSNPRIERNLIMENTSTDNGAGIHVIASTAEIVDNDFFDNEVGVSVNSSGGGVKVNFSTATVLIERNRIMGNTVDFAGGGISILGADAEILDNEVSGNSAPNGGGVHIETQVANGGNRTFVVSGNCIEMNTSTFQGAGVHTFMEGTASPVTITDNLIRNNTCVDAACTSITDPDCCKGGGISAIGGTLPHLVEGNNIEGNTADVFGAGIFDNTSAFPESMSLTFRGNRVTGTRTTRNYPGIACVDTVRCDVLGNEFSDNSTEAPVAAGAFSPGAVYLTGNDVVNVENNYFFENEGNHAGAVLMRLSTQVARFANNTFADNQSIVTSAASLWLDTAADVFNNVFSGDRFGIRATAALTSSLDVRNNNFRDQTSGVMLIVGGATHATAGSLNGESFASGNLAQVPGFLDQANDQYRLAGASALLNDALCGLAPSQDFDGEARPGSAGCDVGADEFNSGTPFPTWPSGCGHIFTDGFESGNLLGWDVTVP